MIDYLNDWVVRGLFSGASAGIGVVIENYFFMRPKVAKIKISLEKAETKIQDLEEDFQENKRIQSEKIKETKELLTLQITQLDSEVKDIKNDIRSGFQTTSSQINSIHMTLINISSSGRQPHENQ